MPNIFQRMMPVIASIGIPIGIGLAGMALPIAYDLKGATAKIEANLSNLEKTAQKEFDQINRKLDDEKKDIEGVAARIKDTETDPAMLMAKAGMVIETDVTVVSVGGTTLTFPKSKDAEARLIKYGYSKREITPVISAYVQATYPLPATFSPSPPLVPPLPATPPKPRG